MSIYIICKIESIEMASFQALLLASLKLRDSHIKQLIRENFDEAKEDKARSLIITTKLIQ